MVPNILLLAVSAFPNANDDYYSGDANLVALAEWFGKVPDLFLFLIGPAPSITSLATYSELKEGQALVCDMDSVLDRWRRFSESANTLQPELQYQLQSIHNLLTQTSMSYLVLDIWGLSEGKKNKQWKDYIKQLIERSVDLQQCLTDEMYLRKLLEKWEFECGYWNPAVIARISDIDFVPLEELKEFDGYQLNDYPSWVASLPAYVVRQKEINSNRAPLGLVTPYGRWLVPLSLGAHDISGCYSDHSDAIEKTQLIVALRFDDLENSYFDSKLLDINGNELTDWLIQQHLSVLSNSVGFISYQSSPSQLIRLPDFEILQENLVNAHAHYLDGFIRTEEESNQIIDGEVESIQYVGLYNLQGKRQIESGLFTFIGPFHRTRQHATAARFNPRFSRSAENKKEIESEKSLLGVIDPSGRSVIPLNYRYVLPTNSELPPKVFDKNKMIAIAVDWSVHIYNLKGQQLEHPECKAIDVLLYTDQMFNSQGFLAINNGYVCQISFEGQLIEKIMTVEAFWEERRKLFSFKKPVYRDVSAAELLALDFRNDLSNLAYCLCFGDEAEAASLANAIFDYIKEDEEFSWSVRDDAFILSPMFGLACYHASESGFGARIDWKDTDTLRDIAGIVHHKFLSGFNWDPMNNGDSMLDGLEALAEYVKSKGFYMILPPEESDLYAINFIRKVDREKLLAVTSQWGIDINI
ncbi:MAG: hypothetical protein ABW044_08380 [Cellvibrio sp.]